MGVDPEGAVAASQATDFWQKFRRIEERWWSAHLAHDSFVNYLDTNGLRSESMRLNAEILFCLCGLKPVVIASEIPAPFRQHFHDHVIIPSGITSYKSDQAEIVVRQLCEMHSPCCDLSGAFVFINIRHSFYPQVGANLFSGTSISDSQLARLLNYPVALDTVDTDHAVEVAYLLKDCRTVSMTYVANRKDLGRVRQHFNMFRDRAGIALDLQVASLQVNRRT